MCYKCADYILQLFWLCNHQVKKDYIEFVTKKIFVWVYVCVQNSGFERKKKERKKERHK